MYLENQLAQTIVERTMSIISNNINVMNSAGVIIGSGEPERIGKVHDGAILALKHGDTIEVTRQACSTLKGAKPGINLVMRSGREVIGVIGITGEPDAIRDYALLVKMTAEMIVEQATLLDQMLWDRRHREEFIVSWLNGTQPEEYFEKWASRLGIDINSPRVAVLIEFDTAEMNQSVRQVVRLLEYPKRDNLVAVMSISEIVVLKPVKLKNGFWDNCVEKQKIEHLLTHLEKYDISNLRIALGHYFKDVRSSYQSAKQVMQLGRVRLPEVKTCFYDDYRMSVLLSPLLKSWHGSQICQAINCLLDVDKNGQLLKTLEALFTHNGSATECAKALFIHRNTLRYRLDKIGDITGLSPYNFSQLSELYIGYIIVVNKLKE